MAHTRTGPHSVSLADGVSLCLGLHMAVPDVLLSPHTVSLAEDVSLWLGLPMAVVSGSFREDVLHSLESAGVADYFGVILGRQVLACLMAMITLPISYNVLIRYMTSAS